MIAKLYRNLDGVETLINTIVVSSYDFLDTLDGYDRVETLPDPEPAPVVPASVSRFQALAALHMAGMLPSVELLMANDETDPIARLAWENALEFRRDSPTVLAMAMALNLDDAALDNLFINAAQIVA